MTDTTAPTVPTMDTANLAPEVVRSGYSNLTIQGRVYVGDDRENPVYDTGVIPEVRNTGRILSSTMKDHLGSRTMREIAKTVGAKDLQIVWQVDGNWAFPLSANDAARMELERANAQNDRLAKQLADLAAQVAALTAAPAAKPAKAAKGVK